MPTDPGLPFWWKALAWLSAIKDAPQRWRNVARDKKLEWYECKGQVVDGNDAYNFAFDFVTAESEEQARELVMATMAKLHPVVFNIGGSFTPREIPSPFVIGNAGHTKMAMQFQKKPLSPEAIEAKRKGEFGPAGTTPEPNESAFFKVS